MELILYFFHSPTNRTYINMTATITKQKKLQM